MKSKLIQFRAPEDFPFKNLDVLYYISNVDSMNTECDAGRAVEYFKLFPRMKVLEDRLHAWSENRRKAYLEQNHES